MKKVIYKIARLLIKLILPIVNFGKVKINSEDARRNITNLCEERELFSSSDIVNLDIDEKIDLSVIIPVYNVEEYLERCLKSVVNQNTKYHFEVIAINDGSTDGSMNILKHYESKYNFFSVILQENQGQATARNTGINHASGKFITFIDSDDCIENDYIEKMMDLAIKNDADITMCSIKEFDIVNQREIKLITHENMSIKDGIKDEILNLKGYIWGKVYKRELWKNIRLPVGFLFEDTIIRTILMRLCNSFEYLDEVLYIYSVRANSVSRKQKRKRKSEKYLEQYFLQEKILELSQNLGLTKDRTLYKILLYELGTCLWLRTRFFDKKIQRDIFVLSCDLIGRYKMESRNFSFEYQYLEKAFEKRNFALWKLISIYMMLGVKVGNE